MEKKMENEMETGLILGYIGVIMGLYWDNGKLNGTTIYGTTILETGGIKVFKDSSLS